MSPPSLRQERLLCLHVTLINLLLLLLLLLIEKLFSRRRNSLIIFDDRSARLDVGRHGRRRHDERHQLLLAPLRDRTSAHEEGEHEDSEADEGARDDQEDVGRGEDSRFFSFGVVVDVLNDDDVVIPGGRDGDNGGLLLVADAVVIQVIVVFVQVLAVILVQEFILLAVCGRPSRLSLSLLLNLNFGIVLIDEMNVILDRRRRCCDVVVVIIIIVVIVISVDLFLVCVVCHFVEGVSVAHRLLLGVVLGLFRTDVSSAGRDVKIVVIVVVVFVVVIPGTLAVQTVSPERSKNLKPCKRSILLF